MKSSFELHYSPEFYKDLFKMLDYIQNELDNEIAAYNLFDKIEKAIIKRARNPISNEKFITIKGNEYYRIYINNYIVFYTVFENDITIRRIIYGRRNIDKLF